MSENETNAFQKLLDDCDLLVKAGRIQVVQQRLNSLNFAQVPRVFRSPLAKICRRAGLISAGLRLLQPLIRHEKKSLAPATAAEHCEYAVLLSRNGSVSEALGLLKAVNVVEAPEALLYEAFCHISNWDYAVAIGLLEAYLCAEADTYTKLIARVNLCAALVITGDLKKASETILAATAQAHEHGAKRLIGNLLELKAQIYIQLQDFEPARRSLIEATAIFSANGSYDKLMIDKWEAIMDSSESKDTTALKTFRARAEQAAHWESVRESDLFLAKLQFQQREFDHLVFGTPMASYRERIYKTLNATPSASYVLGTRKGPALNLRTGTIADTSTESINPGKKVHQCLLALTRDLYQPRNLGTLFSELYPEEFFDINSSALKVRQSIHRTREWLESQALPITIENQKGVYHLKLIGECGIKLELERQPAISNVVRMQQLRTHFAEKAFTADSACKVLSISKSSFHRLAKWAETRGELESTGQARSTLHQCRIQSKNQYKKRSA